MMEDQRDLSAAASLYHKWYDCIPHEGEEALPFCVLTRTEQLRWHIFLRQLEDENERAYRKGKADGVAKGKIEAVAGVC